MATKLYISPESPTFWSDAGNSPDKLMDLGGLGAGLVAVGAYLDLGSGARSDVYEFEFKVDGFASGTMTVGQTVDLYVIQSNDGTVFDGVPGTAPGASTQGVATTNDIRNALYVGSAVVRSTTLGDVLQARFVARLTGRYIAPVVVNRTVLILKSSSDFHKLTVVGIPYESQ